MKKDKILEGITKIIVWIIMIGLGIIITGGLWRIIRLVWFGY